MLGSGYESLPSRVLKRQSSQTHTCTRVQADRSEKERELQRNTGPERERENDRVGNQRKKEKKKAKITVKAWAERVELRCHEKGSFLSIPRDIKEHVEKEGPMLAAVG